MSISARTYANISEHWWNFFLFFQCVENWKLKKIVRKNYCWISYRKKILACWVSFCVEHGGRLIKIFISKIYVPYCVFFCDLIFDCHHKLSHFDLHEVWLSPNLMCSRQIVFGPFFFLSRKSWIVFQNELIIINTYFFSLKRSYVYFYYMTKKVRETNFLISGYFCYEQVSLYEINNYQLFTHSLHSTMKGCIVN